MNSVSKEEGKKRLLEKYGRRQILLVNASSPIHGIKHLHKLTALKSLKMTVREMKDLFDHLPSVIIDGFKYRMIP
jgi:hypothetical protein